MIAMATKESDWDGDAFHRIDAGGDSTTPLAAPAAPDVDAVNRLVGELNAKLLRLEARVETLEGKDADATKRSDAVDGEAEKDFFGEASAPEAECIGEEANETDEKFKGASAPEAEAIEEELNIKCEEVTAAEAKVIIDEEADNKKCEQDLAAEAEAGAGSDEMEAHEEIVSASHHDIEPFSDTKSEVEAGNSINENKSSDGIEAQGETIDAGNQWDVRHLLFTNSSHQCLFIEELDLGECGVRKVLPRDVIGSVWIIAVQLAAYCMLGFLIFSEAGGKGEDGIENGQEYFYDETERTAETAMSKIFKLSNFAVATFAILILCFWLQPDLIGVFLLLTGPGWKAKLAAGIIALEAAAALVVGFISLSLMGAIGYLEAFLLCVGIIFIHDIDEQIGLGMYVLSSACLLRGSRRTELHFWLFYFAFIGVLIIIGMFGILFPIIQRDMQQAG